MYPNYCQPSTSVKILNQRGSMLVIALFVIVVLVVMLYFIFRVERTSSKNDSDELGKI